MTAWMGSAPDQIEVFGALSTCYSSARASDEEGGRGVLSDSVMGGGPDTALSASVSAETEIHVTDVSVGPVMDLEHCSCLVEWLWYMSHCPVA